MASNTDFVQYIADQCSGAGDIVTKKMFGDYAIYCDGKIFGLICDDCFFVKPTAAGSGMRNSVRHTKGRKIISTSPMWTTATTSPRSSARPVRLCPNQRSENDRETAVSISNNV